MIRNLVKAIPSEVFTQDDKKARLRTIRENLKKITFDGKSRYDISSLLETQIHASTTA